MLSNGQSLLKVKDKIETKGQGISTHNYVATEQQQKQWLKVKYSPNLHLLQQQNNYYNILSSLAQKSKLPSILSIQEISIYVRKNQRNQNQKQKVFEIQRPYLDLSLREMLQQRYRDELYTLIPQFFFLFLESSQIEKNLCLLNTPANFLIKKLWSNKYVMFNNYTSLVGFEFFIQKQDILTSKFQEFACYIHPSLFNFQTKELNICFETKLYSLTILILSLLIKKQFQRPLQSRKHTVNVNDVKIKDKWQAICRNMIKLLSNPIIENQISQKLKRHNQFLTLKRFIKKMREQFSEFQPRKKGSKLHFQCWVDVFQILKPQFLNNYMKQQTTHAIKLIQKILQNQSKQTLQYYKKMGIIHPKKDLNKDIKGIAIYFMLKMGDFQCLSKIFQQIPAQTNSTKLKDRHEKYITLLNLAENCQRQEKYLLSQVQQKDKEEQQQEQNPFLKENLNIEKYVEQTTLYNVSSFQLQSNQLNDGGTIYTPNQFQKTLDIYGAYLWP